MYCVYCGVKLQDGAAECPLCHTPVMHPDRKDGEQRTLYPDRLPAEERHGRALLVWILSLVMVGISMACLFLCLHRYHEVGWSGYVMMSMALAWVWVLLPLLFPRFRPMIFLPIDFACLAGFLLYICAKNGEHWFLSFAFPVTAIMAVLTLLGVAIFRYIRAGRLRLCDCLRRTGAVPVCCDADSAAARPSEENFLFLNKEHKGSCLRINKWSLGGFPIAPYDPFSQPEGKAICVFKELMLCPKRD